ncbi:MAG TPA: heme-binding protein [Eoetvoesiella sp.]|uniref:GlcG/HbpS family heme-binding protein n=1 Tax=Eoetvoesiella sp. TaxID=1966355 RepID=UPI002BA8F03E|nr:heme-binding protein [Eoetvoesiella sp.]HWK62098.1 heme-binding protein [Eoetvoesiella sp.]
MHSKLSLSLEDARWLCAAAQAAAADLGLPVSIAVVDSTTYMQAMARMDGAPLMSAQGAFDKARSAAEGGHPTTFFEKPLNEGRFSMVTMPHTPVEGGVPVFVLEQCVGAVGVAGGPPHLDAKIAEMAIAAFVAKTGETR